jgi:hypothetical protein
MDNDVELVHADMTGMEGVKGSYSACGRSHRESKIFRNWLRICRRLRLHASLSLRDGEYVDIDESTEIKVLLRSGRAIQLGGFYLAAPGCLAKHKNDILKALRFDDVVWNEVERTKRSVILHDRVNVAVHMRRGDYRRFLGGMMYYSDGVYETVAALVARTSAGAVRFHLFSDDEISGEAFGKFDTIFHRGNSPEVDIGLMASCDAIVGPNSSFSQWASFIGDIPIYVLSPEVVSRISELEGLPRSDFNVFEASRFGEKASTRISVESRLVRPFVE